MKAFVLRVLRVPPEPEAPAGDRLRVFRAGRNFYKYKIVLWSITQVGAIVGAVAGLLVLRRVEGSIAYPPALFIARTIELAGLVALAFQIPFTWAVLKLNYEMRWYVVTDRSLRIREGVATVVEKTMTFRNIQNIAIRQGPIQRALGIADVEVRTAGGGASRTSEGSHGPGEEMHVATFRGVDNAEEIRDVIAERLRRYRDAGLGDPDDAHAQVSGSVAADAATLDAARQLLAEARGLRSAVEGTMSSRA